VGTSKKDEAKTILRFIREELRYLDEDLRNDGLLPEVTSLRSIYEQLSALHDAIEGKPKKVFKPESDKSKKTKDLIEKDLK
tara:strand:+ start:435 stop:677 length:243 start_codon:yes stop_codon:yes gene_type:complete